ncbi:MAG: hypothetical protein EA343_19785 [Nodularia sp. (in: Bacteria)]|nr:MAG: hypothetical protein EA343_19785 [Nodularia sp. (in: cyanobacteria)]
MERLYKGFDNYGGIAWFNIKGFDRAIAYILQVPEPVQSPEFITLTLSDLKVRRFLRPHGLNILFTQVPRLTTFAFDGVVISPQGFSGVDFPPVRG